MRSSQTLIHVERYVGVEIRSIVVKTTTYCIRCTCQGPVGVEKLPSLVAHVSASCPRFAQSKPLAGFSGVAMKKSTIDG